MYFLALLLTLSTQDQSSPLSHGEGQRIAQELGKQFSLGTSSVARETDQSLLLLQIALVHSDEHVLVLRITAIESRKSSHFSTLLTTMQRAEPFLLDHRRYEVASVDLAGNPWAGVSSWADIQRAEPHPLMHLTFSSPVMMASPYEQAQRDALPFPEPVPLFSRLEERWQALQGPLLRDNAAQLVQTARCVLAEYRLETVEVDSQAHPQIGYVGSLVYECLSRQSRDAILTLNALARLAFFTGCGYETNQGWGLTHVTFQKGG